LCILSSAEVKLDIVGMALCPDRDHHIVVWGTSEEVLVFLLDKSCNDVEARVDLIVGLELNEYENEYLLKVEWMQSSSGVSNLQFSASF
jgi:hypothetical protein